MRNKQWRMVALVLVLLLLPLKAYADSASSPNYQVNQTFFGTGGELNACSTGPNGYCAKETAGELTVGNTQGTAFQAYAGFNTTDDPYLEFFVTSATIDLGVLDSTQATTTSGQFYVRAWQADGYVVRTEADLPANGQGGHQMTGLSSPTASSPGTEQFGINLVNNNTPNVGADPVQTTTFSNGQVEPGYDTADQFKYVKGDVIARSTTSTSATIFTISYLYNISNATPAGSYTFNHILVATGTY